MGRNFCQKQNILLLAKKAAVTTNFKITAQQRLTINQLNGSRIICYNSLSKEQLGLIWERRHAGDPNYFYMIT